RPTNSRLRFQPSRPAPSLPHQVPNEHAENAGTRKRRPPEEPPALDPLENTIRQYRPFTDGWGTREMDPKRPSDQHRLSAGSSLAGDRHALPQLPEGEAHRLRI